MPEPDDILDLAAVGLTDIARVGGKAARLGRLITDGFPVPAGFCITTGVYDELVGPVVAQARTELGLAPAGPLGVEAHEELAARVRKAIDELVLPSGLVRRIAGLMQDRPAAAGFAVRSSGTAEDTADASFAGQYSTSLRVSGPDAVSVAVRDCWASLWSPGAVLYRARHLSDPAAARMAVVVQAMVDARCAGVAFVPAAEDAVVVVEAVEGTGDRLVDGVVTPEHLEVGPAGTPLRRSAAGGGTVLGDAEATQLAALGREVREALGGGQDIEWAHDGVTFHLLQARPITADAPTSGTGSWVSPVEGASWARISICDSWLPEPLSPMFATSLFPRLIQEWTANWAGHGNRLVPSPMHGTVEGYAYLRIDFPLNRHPWLTVRLVAAFFRFHLSPVERIWREQVLPPHRRRVEELARLELTALSPVELARVLDELETLGARYWAVIGGLAWYWNVGEWVLARAFPASRLRAAGPEPDPPSYATLLQGRASLAHEAECMLHDLAAAPPAQFEAGLEAYLRRFGHLVYHLDISEPTPGEEPEAAREAVEAYRDGRAGDPRERLLQLRRRSQEVLDSARRVLRRAPVRRRVLDGALRWTLHWSEVRDQALHNFTLPWPLMRAVHLELGRRLSAAGALPAAADVFMLTGDELRAWCREPDRTDTSAWARETAERAQERERRRLLTPPDTVPPDVRIHLGPWDITALALFGQMEGKGAEGELRGSGVSAGRVRGRVRLLRSVREAGDLSGEDVLVVPHLTPAWSSVIARAGAVVTDVGGSLSHGSIVARELGVPAVMGTGNATKVLREGQLVDVDGGAGVVRLRDEGLPR